jgi:hypothetical protein
LLASCWLDDLSKGYPPPRQRRGQATVEGFEGRIQMTTEQLMEAAIQTVKQMSSAEKAKLRKEIARQLGGRGGKTQ